jgi:hypothetical protein
MGFPFRAQRATASTPLRHFIVYSAANQVRNTFVEGKNFTPCAPSAWLFSTAAADVFDLC